VISKHLTGKDNKQIRSDEELALETSAVRYVSKVEIWPLQLVKINIPDGVLFRASARLPCFALFQIPVSIAPANTNSNLCCIENHILLFPRSNGLDVVIYADK